MVGWETRMVLLSSVCFCVDKYLDIYIEIPDSSHPPSDGVGVQVIEVLPLLGQTDGAHLGLGGHCVSLLPFV